MKKVIVHFIIISISVILALILNNVFFPKQKTGWISVPQVFNGFEYKKELEKKYTKSEEARKKIIDSLELDLKVLYKTIKTSKKEDVALNSKFEFQRQNFVEKQHQLEEDNANMKNEFNTQILNQLNQYVKDYGKENNYKFILGAEGNGSLMYGAESEDLTKEIITYINNKYSGINNK